MADEEYKDVTLDPGLIDNQLAPQSQGAQSAREQGKLSLDLKSKDKVSMKNNFMDQATGRGGQRTLEEEQQYQRQKQSAEAMLSNFKFDFHGQDPDKRFRVQAIIQKTIGEAKMKMNKKLFAKHLENSKKQPRDITDSKKSRRKNRELVKADFYSRRDALIVQETGFDLRAEQEYQAKAHHKFESNAEDSQTGGWLPIIEELNKNKQIWDGLVLVMAIFNSFAVPLEYVITDLEENNQYAIIDLIINIMFGIDIILGFRTTFFDAYGMEVRDPKQITMNYLKGMFVVDFLSSIPYRYVALVIPFFKTISVFKILKIARISRFAPFVQKLELDEGDKAMLKIFQLILTLVLILHCLGCFWFQIVILDSVWAPPLDFIYVQRNEYNRFYDMEQVTQTYQFLVVLYLAVLALGGNEMGPRTDTEICAMFFILTGLILVNAYVFGQMSVLVSEASKKSAKLQNQIDVANTSMNNLELKADTKSDIRMYLISTQGTQYEQVQLKEFFEMISPTLKEKVSIEIFLEVVKNNLQMRTAIMQIAKEWVKAHPFPKKTIAQAEEIIILPIVTKMETDLLQPDCMIIEKLEPAKGLYLIAKGECVVDFRHGNLHTQETSQMLRKAEKMCGIVSAADKKADAHLKQKVLRQGQLFGEISLIYDCLTTASVIALKYCTIGKLRIDDFNEICLQHPQILKYVKEGIFEYNDKDMRFIKMALKQLPFFAHLQDRDTIFYEIIYQLNTFKMNAGAMLINEGDPINEIYIVERGIVEVFVVMNGKEFVLERLFRGSVINYKNIFSESTSMVGIRFAAESVIKSLSKTDLNEIRRNNKELHRAIQKFELKVAKIPQSPLDYILVLPKKVYSKLIERTRERMLFEKQENLMDSLQEKKDYHKKYQGLDMDDHQIAKTLSQLQREFLSDQEVIIYLTKMNHLELRVKNVAVKKMLTQRQQHQKSNVAQGLTKLIKMASKKDMNRLKLVRMDTKQLASDGLVSRLSDKIQETNRKIGMQQHSINKIMSNVEMLLPVKQRVAYNIPTDSPQSELDSLMDGKTMINTK